MTVRWKSLSWFWNLEDSVEITFQEHAVFPLMNPFHIVVLQVMVHLFSGKIVFAHALLHSIVVGAYRSIAFFFYDVDVMFGIIGEPLDSFARYAVLVDEVVHCR